MPCGKSLFMSIAGLVDEQVMNHLAHFGCVKGMDPYALHLLKTSSHPLLRARRDWMRREALRQCLEAHKRQQKINDDFAREPLNKRATWRRCAVIDPYFAEEMQRRHGATWSDQDFLGSVREANPKLFPDRG